MDFLAIIIAIISLLIAIYIAYFQKKFSEMVEIRSIMLSIWKQSIVIRDRFTHYEKNNKDYLELSDECLILLSEIYTFFDEKYFTGNTIITIRNLQEHRQKLSLYMNQGIQDEEINPITYINQIETYLFQIITSLYRKYPKQKCSY